MPRTTMQKRTRGFNRLLVSAALFIAGCGQIPVNKDAMDAPATASTENRNGILDYVDAKPSTKSAQSAAFDRESLISLVKEARSSRSPRREALLIKATHTALSQNPVEGVPEQWSEQVDLAQKIYGLINTEKLSSNADLDYYYELIGLELAVAQQNKEEAGAKLKALDAISSARKIPLSTRHYLTDSRIRASALALQGDPMAAARLLIFRVEGVKIPEDERQSLHDHAWHYLSIHRMSLENRKKRASNLNLSQAASEEWQAWLELNDIFTLNSKSQIGRLHGKLQSWARDWTSTDVGQLPPMEITDLLLADFKQVRHVAVFLPTSGKLQHAGKAIVDGIMASYYREQTQTSAQLKLSMYDTASGNSMESLVSKARNAGAELIIGPLEKDNVEALKQYMAGTQNPRHLLPVLALNYTNEADVLPSRHFFEFGLSAEDEAMAVAEHAVSKRLDRALILRPNSDWGSRVSDAFKGQFEQLGGRVLDEAAFSEPRQFSKEVQDLLGLEVSKSRHREIERQLGKKLDFTPRRRQDVDFIFLVASPKEARQLKPTINYHYGQNIPVLATSHIYSGSENSKFDKDLNGVYFVDIPWVLKQDIELKKAFDEHIPNAQTQFKRLHALGIDAFSLMREFSVLKHVAKSELKGATGVLTIQADGRVKRQLSWAKFRRGKAQPVLSTDE